MLRKNIVILLLTSIILFSFPTVLTKSKYVWQKEISFTLDINIGNTSDISENLTDGFENQNTDTIQGNNFTTDNLETEENKEADDSVKSENEEIESSETEENIDNSENNTQETIDKNQNEQIAIEENKEVEIIKENENITQENGDLNNFEESTAQQ